MRTVLILLISLLSYFSYGQLSIDLEEHAGGFNSIVKIASNGIDERLYVVERSGVIYIVEEDGTRVESPFLDIDELVFDASGQSERGLLGLAFHPNFENNGLFFINYTDNDGDTQIARYMVDPDNHDANAQLDTIILSIPQPYSNHNGGDLAFGPDGYLYIGTGDGGSGNDPLDAGQDRLSLLGKMLRIDIDQEPYGIPEDNPFAQTDGTLDEIWAVGLRNPWRYSFDQMTGDLWIADVGQFSIEEIDFQAAGSAGGQNYGWRCYEGSMINTNVSQDDCIAFEETTPPIYEYNHAPENHCSITGGYVYRGCDYPELHGYYLYADVCTGYVWGLKQSDTGEVENIELLTEGGNWTTFGESSSGQLYIAGLYNGIVYKITSEVKMDDVNIGGVDDALFALNGDELIDAESFSFQWYLFDEPIEGANENTFLPIGDGQYHVVITHASGCIYITEPTDFYTSTSDLELQDISVTPNPFRDKISIDLSSIKDVQVEITVIDLSGKSVYTQKAEGGSSVTIDRLWVLPTGVYILKIQTIQGEWVQKVVKR